METGQHHLGHLVLTTFGRLQQTFFNFELRATIHHGDKEQSSTGDKQPEGSFLLRFFMEWRLALRSSVSWRSSQQRSPSGTRATAETRDVETEKRGSRGLVGLPFMFWQVWCPKWTDGPTKSCWLCGMLGKTWGFWLEFVWLKRRRSWAAWWHYIYQYTGRSSELMRYRRVTDELWGGDWIII